MALNLPTFYKRTASAAVFAAIMLTGLLWQQWPFLVLVLLINTLCLNDYFKLIKKIFPDDFWPTWLPFMAQAVGGLALITFYLTKSGTWVIHFWPAAALLPAILFTRSALSTPPFIKALALSILGLAYITIPMFFLLEMRVHEYYLPLTLILMIWANDTLAYLVGSFIGKTPFSPISPKKTWEGTAGGALLTIAGAVVCSIYVQHYTIIDWITLALCAALFGTVGDLLESKLKRMADVKDSGTLMPGHGGAMDRFDSLLLAAPFAGAYVIYVMRG